MKFKIVNTANSKEYNVSLADEAESRESVSSEMKDEEICPICNHKISECECKKEAEVHDEKHELDKEQFEALEELIGLLPDLKKLLKKPSEEKAEEKEAESESKEKEEEKEEKSEAKEKKDELEILLEGSDDDKETELEESDFEEEDVIEDESGNGVHDSVLNTGMVEKQVSYGNTDTVTHEIEVAEAWNKRYESLLKSK